MCRYSLTDECDKSTAKVPWRTPELITAGTVFCERDERALRFAVSPDESTILYDKRVSEGTDLMLIENFR
jgi:hypothetical protein